MGSGGGMALKLKVWLVLGQILALIFAVDLWFSHQQLRHEMRRQAEDNARAIYQILLATREVSINWWVPTRACVRKWFDGAGFSHVSVDGTVTLQPDRPFADAFGNSSACRQVLHLVNARP